MRPTAGNAALRPAQNNSRSASEPEARQVTRAAVERDRLDPRQQVIDLGLRAVELDDQQRLDVERIAGMDELLDRVDRRLVHHLHAARNDAGPDDPGDAIAGLLRRSRSPTSTARAHSGLRRMRTVTSVTTPSSPSEPVMTPSRS